MRRLNPSRIGRRATPVALKPFALLVFLTYNEAPKSAKRRRSPQFGRNAAEVCRKTRRFRPCRHRLKCDAYQTIELTSGFGRQRLP
jgi:hypothetical protein